MGGNATENGLQAATAGLQNALGSAGAAAAKAAAQAEEKLKEFANKFQEEAAQLWADYKYYIIGGGAGAVILIIIICCCCIRCCRKKKKKKNDEKIKLKGSKPKKKLKRIQPNKVERQVMEELGSISFSVKYDKSKEVLSVKIVESENIPVHDISGYAYAFVVAKILPLHKEEEVEHKTKPVRAGFWPAFGDLLDFDIEKDVLNEQVLYLYQYELNRWSKHDGIGQVAYELKDASLLKEKVGEVEVKKKLRPYDPLIGLEVESGAVFLVIEYEPETWELKVEVRQADIIPQEDEEKASSYVTLALLNKDEEVLEKRKSCKKKDTLQPVYEDEFTYTVPDNMLPDVQMVLKIKTPHLVKKSTVLGKSTILPSSDNWKQLLEKEYTQGWFPVYSKPKNK